MVVSMPLLSSTVITPSLPTLSMASAMRLPIVGSLAEMLATDWMASLVSTGLATLWISSTATATARSMPRLTAIGLAPAATTLRPSRMSDWARMVAVVVPSPATSSVFVATSRTSCAPAFSKGSSSSISRATVTPSCVIVGEPNFFSNTTLRPLGPRVIFTASASLFTPRSIARRATSSNASIFGTRLHLHANTGSGIRDRGSDQTPCRLPDPGSRIPLLLLLAGRHGLALKDGQNVALPQDQVFNCIDLEFGPGILRIEDVIAHLDVQGQSLLALLVPFSRTDGYDLTALGLLLRGVGQHNPALGPVLVLHRLDQHAVSKGPQLHRYSSLYGMD